MKGFPFEGISLDIKVDDKQSSISIPVEVDGGGELMSGNFSVPNETNTEIFLSVWWDTGDCPIVGYKNLKHNKALQSTASGGD